MKPHYITLHYSTKYWCWVGGPRVRSNLPSPTTHVRLLQIWSFIREGGMPPRAHMQCILNVHIKTYKCAWGASCIRRVLNERASHSGRLCPQTPYQGLPLPGLYVIPMTPVVDPLDAKPGATRVHNACVVHNWWISYVVCKWHNDEE